ncbi:creatininase family protein [Halobacterium salinarum]|nr:creatininase family protein [Halobacterium salinarum]MBB6090976.1 creatinine amidohydrolase [Halobacterium salinarum]UEB92166.1 creatininase family protein [Halobacterium salinarum NRC-34001]CAP13004.1 creatininase domain protein [Halobacterium salinarum R1]DAC77435.1 TPA_inf: creatininase domain protein [Halobacterium salinarum NRC-1]
MRLADATWTDADGVDTDLAVLPVGSTEQHGPHAPLGTDHITAHAVAAAGADAYSDGEVIVAPPITVGVSAEHRQFTGTLWVAPDTFRATVRDVVGSLASHGWDRVVVVNGHGGNTAALGEVCATITRQDDAYAVPFTWFDAVGDHSSDMGHAGPLETAFLRHTDPELIREDRVQAAAEDGADAWGKWVSHANLAADAAAFTDNGVVGDPRAGDADRGAALLDAATESLCALLAAVADRDTTAPLPHR